MLPQIAVARTLDDINKDIQNNSNQRNQLSEQEKTLAQQLADTETRLFNLNTDIAQLEDQLAVIGKSKAEAESILFKKQAELAVAEDKLDVQTSVLGKRLEQIYKRGDMGYFDVIMGATDFNDFLTRLDYLKYIARSDKKLLKSVRIVKDKVETERDILEEKRQEVLSRKRAIEDIKKPLDIMEDQIQNELAYKESLLTQVKNDQSAANEILAALMTEQRAASGRGVGGGVGPSGFMWPVSIPSLDWITSPYGYRVHPIWGDIRFHYGLDIGVDEGTQIVSPAAGTVCYVGWSSVVGNTVEIDHGGGIKTRYCHLQTGGVYVSEGDVLAQGQVFALVGNTGSSTTGAHLHFEVYDFNTSDELAAPYYTYSTGYTVDPLNWLPH
jgi:murein DD-endopeptidase MepM/ murein hydrolase activator NlpD